ITQPISKNTSNLFSNLVSRWCMAMCESASFYAKTGNTMTLLCSLGRALPPSSWTIVECTAREQRLSTILLTYTTYVWDDNPHMNGMLRGSNYSQQNTKLSKNH